MKYEFIKKIDKLGRIVIPLELRDYLQIKEYDDLKIKIDDKNIILSKYSYLSNHEKLINKIVSTFNSENINILISDRQQIINEGKYQHKNLTTRLFNLIKEPKVYDSNTSECLIPDNPSLFGFYLINPIYNDGICSGLIIIVSDNNISKELKLIANLLKNIIENLNLLC